MFQYDHETNFRAYSETSSSPRPKFPREKVEDQSAVELFFLMYRM